MARHRRKKATGRRRRRNRGYSHRRSNPVMHYRRRRSRRHGRRGRRRNPGAGLIPARPLGMLTTGLYVLGGMVGTRAATQLALGSKNQGVLGYVGNAITAGVLGQLVGRGLLKSRQAANWITIGGFAGIAARLLQDFTPVGRMLNLQLAGVGDWGMAGFVPQAFPVPQESAGWPNVQIPGSWRPAAAAVSGLGRLGAGRLGRNRLTGV